MIIKNRKVKKHMKVIKRNGKEVDYDFNKIISAVKKANASIPDPKKRMTDNQINVVAEKVEITLDENNITTPTIEDIQTIVIHSIMAQQAYDVAQHYTEYRYKRAIARKRNSTDDAIMSLIETENENVIQENSNKNPQILSVQRDYIAGEVSKDLTDRVLLPDDLVKAHHDGILHFHDRDYFLQHMHNCDLINLDDMLQNGTVISETMIDKPHRFATAANIATQIIAQVASSQYGGQTFSLAHLVPFVQLSRQYHIDEIIAEGKLINKTYTQEEIQTMAEHRLAKEITAGIQTIQYQLVTLMTTNGQTPFVTLYMDINEADEIYHDDMALLIAEILKQRIKGIKNEKGVFIMPAFPKLIYTLDENNIYPDSKYYDLTVLANKCTDARMVPDFISAKIMREAKGDVYPCMGCRSFLTPDRFTDNGVGNIAKAKNYKPGQHKYYGRFNQGVITINLVDVACSSNKNMNAFWKILNDRLDLCHRGLRIRHERLLGTVSDVAPILWQHGALARLEKGEVIDPLLYNGYSTISLGYAGLYEMCMYMTGKSHTDPEGKIFALAVMQHLNDKCAEWKAAENIDYSVYGTPIESTTERFAKNLQRRFGIIKNVTDHDYITNSYHVNVREEIDAFTKLTFESEFQLLSPGGAISYIECPDMQNNPEAGMQISNFIYETILYAERNSKSDYCHVCDYSGEIKIIAVDGKLIWECPNCGNRDQNKMNVARRTCGYIGMQFWNQGRTQEINDRVIHISIPTVTNLPITELTIPL